MTLDFLTVDVFTRDRFGGNPLAVVIDADGLDEGQMQAIAREFNLSETVFLLRPQTDGEVRVRIFTPVRELPFAGHPTVGSALALHHLGRTPVPDAEGRIRIRIEEGVGPVPVTLDPGPGPDPWTGTRATLTAPRGVEEIPWSPPISDLAGALGIRPEEIGTPTVLPEGLLAPAVASAGIPFLILPLRGTAALSRARPDGARLEAALSGAPTREVYLVASLPGEGVGRPIRRWATRMFAPSLGVPEDPATGSAAAALSGYLARRLAPPGAPSTLSWTLFQGAEMGRPSRIDIEAEMGARGGLAAVRVGGEGVLVMEGRIRV